MEGNTINSCFFWVGALWLLQNFKFSLIIRQHPNIPGSLEILFDVVWICVCVRLRVSARVVPACAVASVLTLFFSSRRLLQNFRLKCHSSLKGTRLN